jgi:Na+-translocating ferredoxin:NAD+ oxidoreductase RNF subunit RnfB
MNILGVIILSMVGFGSGLSIYLANKFLPSEAEHLKKAEGISEILPGMNCGACGLAGCFAYAQALAKDKDVIIATPCMVMMKDEDAVAKLEKKLDMKIGSAEMSKAAIIHCNGKSDVKYDYHGINTCKAASQLVGGYKKCPFGCLGLGDCIAACPENAIYIDKEKDIAIINKEKCIGCGLCTKECPNDLIEVVSLKIPQYLGCSYTQKKNIVGREKCKVGCIHCKICEKTTPDALIWDEKQDLPRFIEKSIDAPESVKKCPKHIIIPLALEIKEEVVVDKK